MCGIIGHAGRGENIVPECLEKLEYRGYDSAGIAALNGSGIEVSKGVGTVDEAVEPPQGSTAIGHTRWATHGGVTRTNAHPHTDTDQKVAVVHNGIIDNHSSLRREIGESNFESETDTEVIPHLLAKHLENGLNPREAAQKVTNRIEGSYAAVALLESGQIVAFKHGAPLAVAENRGEHFFSSDVVPLLEHVDEAAFLEDGDIAVLDSGPTVFNQGNEVSRESREIRWEGGSATRGDFDHFTRKEIGQQPETIKRATFQDEESLAEAADMLEDARTVWITGCGTSSYAADHMRDYLAPEIDARSIQSHELEYRTAEVDEGDAVVAVSQSGETKDLLAALEDVGVPVLSFLNVAQSSLERRSDHTIYVNAGPEVGVASTKAYTAQLAAMKTVASEIKDQEQVANSLHGTAEKAEEVIEASESLAQELQSRLGGEDAYFVGRYQRFHSAKEASLKLKELSYIHSEAFPAGEFKHGTLALVEEGTPVVGFVDEETADETLSNLEEASSRGAEIIGVGPENHDVYDLHTRIPEDPNREILEVIPFQMLALKAALGRGNDPDRPRNLAKSVTVK
jgi:glucosamine--fructose-6-phosphate aminotransferase (isomerizing)